MAKGQFVELAFEGEDQILTFLGEFGDGPAPTPTARLGDHQPRWDHRASPQPDPGARPDRRQHDDLGARLQPAYYDNLLYNKAQNPSMANWYLEQSYGRYSVDGYVSDWVHGPEQRGRLRQRLLRQHRLHPGHRPLPGRSGQRAGASSRSPAGKSQADIDALLASFDVWDRYDYDGDGNFNEPDGYIDHFQSVHAGEGEETGGGAQGTDAIWSHRSYANACAFGADGPTVGGNVVPFGGLPIACSNKWIGDYTIEPENGGVGVFSHEFGHDLGLPGRVRHQRQHRRRREQHRLVDPLVAGLVRHRQRHRPRVAPGRRDGLGTTRPRLVECASSSTPARQARSS